MKLIDENINFSLNDKLTILLAPNGRGKKTIIKNYCINNNIVYCPIGYGVNDIRELKDNIYTIGKVNIVYCIEDGDLLTNQAQNALLKICEESPNNIKIVLCNVSIFSMIIPLLNRSRIFSIPLLQKVYLQSYIEEKISCSDNGYNTLKDKLMVICDTYGDVDRLLKYKNEQLDDLIDLSIKILESIEEVSDVNALKILEKIKTKHDDDGYEFYDLLLILRASNKIQNLNLNKKKKYHNAISIAMKMLSRHSVKMVFDNWVFDMRDDY